jgi:UDP-4-amino-4-deoxy-L-arabinose-oxoglutarate aminotransferase
MRNNFLPFTKPHISEEEIELAVEVMRSGWITNGPKNSEFEKSICDYTGAKFAIALSSATAGMHLLLHAMDIGPGDEVITPSLTWVSTINMIELRGATPVFADIDKHSLMITPESIKKCITKKTKLIIPVHYAGAPADMDGILEIAGNIPVVEDAAHAIGTSYKGHKIGELGTAIFSFHAIKNITTAEGGMFVTDNEQLAAKIRMLKFHGLGVDAFDRQNKGRAPQSEVVEPGFKYNMTDISAALGIRQLSRIEEINSKRKVLAEEYLKLLEDIDEIIPLTIPSYSLNHAWHLFIIRVNSDKLSRDDFMSRLKLINIGTGLHFRAAHSQKYYREKYNISEKALENTNWNNARICSLPLFPGMAIKDVHDVIDAIKQVLM